MKTTLTPEQLAHFRGLLIERIARIYNEVHSDVRRDVQGGQLNQPDPGDEADEAMGIQLGDFKLTLDERSAKLAQAMEGALGRIKRGEYGMCDECGRAIELERLELVPWTTRCADCQEALEAETQERSPTL
ncbi:MAG: TraR/DksA family transcriptional regulator [Polyangia bacterium]